MIGLLGVAVVVFLPLISKNSLYSGDMKGNLLISFGVFFWSLYIVFSKRLQKDYSPLVITSVFIFMASLIFLLLSLTEIKSGQSWLQYINAGTWSAIVYLSVLGTVGSYLVNQYAIKLAGPVLASLSFYLLPIFSYISSFILLGERLTAGLIIGTLIVFVSVFLTTYIK